MRAIASRSTVRRWAQWMGKIGFELEPLAEHILARIK